MGANESRSMTDPQEVVVTNTWDYKKEILLISPYAKGLSDPLAYPPLGLLYIAANMSPEWKPEILIMEDDNFNRFDYRYYAISVHSVGIYWEAIKIIEQIRANTKDSQIFIGGAGAGLFRGFSDVEVISGEAEGYFGNVDLDNLDTIQFPARHLVADRFIKHNGNVHHADELSTTIIATRGCPYNCSFCDRVIMGRKFRKRSVANIIKEIREVREHYGIKWFRFIDDCITVDRKWFTELCFWLGIIKVKWTVLSRSDLIDLPLLKIMKNNGCQEIFFGFESGSQKILDLMNKKITVEQNKKAIKLCKEVEITCCAYMMFGFPGEDENTVNETITFLEEAKPEKTRISTYLPIPNTDVWLNPDKYGVRIKHNYQYYWYFDNKEFALEYNYLSNSEMGKLKDKIMSYYVQSGYLKDWTKQKERKYDS